jgi:phage gp16-like protein
MSPAKAISADERRRRDLAMIHIAKKKCGLSEDTYRELLYNIAGVNSAADLDSKGRERILKHLKACGFRSFHKSAKASGMHIPASPDKALMLSKIGAILSDLDKPWSYADGISKRAFKVDMVRWCNTEQLFKVMQMLIIYQKDQHRKHEEGSNVER